MHQYNPETVSLLQHSARTGNYQLFKRYSTTVNELTTKAGALRGLFEMKTGMRSPIPLDEVEPVDSIVKRFATGAMSYGSISEEAHTDLAIAMNRLGPAFQHGRGRRGRGSAARPQPAVSGQAGRQRSVRGHHRVPRQLRRHPDQDGAGGQAR